MRQRACADTEQVSILKTFSRYSIYGLFCVILAFFFLTAFLGFFLNLEKTRFALLLVISFFSTIIGCRYLFKIWEVKMQHSVNRLVAIKIQQFKNLNANELPELYFYKNENKKLHQEIEELHISYEHQIKLLHISVTKAKEEIHQTNLEMDKKLEEMRLAYHEFEDLRREHKRLEEDYKHLKGEQEYQLSHKDLLLSDYQKTITEQRHIIEKKQRYIAKLEGKVRDLMYEIRNLLQLEQPAEKTEFFSQSYDFKKQFCRYIEKIESLTGAEHLGQIEGSHYYELSFDSYAIDKRRLSDIFNEETCGVIFLYSSLEKKMLFINSHIKTLLGWNVEKFSKDFPYLIVSGKNEWHTATTRNNTKEYQFKTDLLDKKGSKRKFMCTMRLLEKGPFANHYFGMFTELQDQI